jgi:hypothetical protein
MIAENYGVYAGLSMVTGLLIAAALALLLAARARAQTLSNLRIFSQSFSPTARDTSAPQAAPVLAPTSPRAFGAESNESAGDLFEPLAFAFAKYVRFPELGNPVLDQFVGSLRASAQGTADDAAGGQSNPTWRPDSASRHVRGCGVCRVAARAAK